MRLRWSSLACILFPRITFTVYPYLLKAIATGTHISVLLTAFHVKGAAITSGAWVSSFDFHGLNEVSDGVSPSRPTAQGRTVVANETEALSSLAKYSGNLGMKNGNLDVSTLSSFNIEQLKLSEIKSLGTYARWYRLIFRNDTYIIKTSHQKRWGGQDLN